jgi:chromosome segregation ATPase
MPEQDFSQFQQKVKSHLSKRQQIHKAKSDILTASHSNIAVCKQFITTADSNPLKTDFSFATNYQVGAEHRTQAEAIQFRVGDIQGKIDGVNAESETLNSQIANAEKQIEKIKQDIKNRNIGIAISTLVIIGVIYALVN